MNDNWFINYAYPFWAAKSLTAAADDSGKKIVRNGFEQATQ